MDNRCWELFECQRCGICCKGIDLPYDDRSIIRIAEYLGLTVEQTFQKYYGVISQDGKSWKFEEDKRNPCPFLMTGEDRKFSCSIHPFKPEACSLYPFDSTGTLDCPVARIVIEKIREEDA